MQWRWKRESVRKTLVSPLHMALIASAVDHDGILMRPYLVNNIQNDSGVEVSSNKPKTYATLMTETGISFCHSKYMRAVVTDGTGRKLSGCLLTCVVRTL